MSDPQLLAPPSFPPIPPFIAELTAPLLIGTLMNWYLYGVVSLQVYVYYTSFPDDRRAIKCLVYSIFLLETLQTCLSAADIYYWFASGYGDLIRLGNPYISAFDTPMLSGIISVIVQGFFSYRIWIFNKSAWWLSVMIGAISITQCVAGMVGGVLGHIAGSFALTAQAKIALYLWLIGDAVADVVIATTMVYLLMQRRTKEHRFTNTVLMRTMRLIVETNALTAGFALLSIALYAAKPNSNYFIAPTLAIGKIYSNTLVATFNNRIFFQHDKASSSAPVHATGVKFDIRAPTVMERSFDSDKIGTDIDIEMADIDTIKISTSTATKEH